MRAIHSHARETTTAMPATAPRGGSQASAVAEQVLLEQHELRHCQQDDTREREAGFRKVGGDHRSMTKSGAWQAQQGGKGAATELLHTDTWILAVQAAPTARRGTQAFSPGNESLGHVRRAAPTETLKNTSTSSLTPVLGPMTGTMAGTGKLHLPPVARQDEWINGPAIPKKKKKKKKKQSEDDNDQKD
jgi:hypothetical protein